MGVSPGGWGPKKLIPNTAPFSLPGTMLFLRLALGIPVVENDVNQGGLDVYVGACRFDDLAGPVRV